MLISRYPVTKDASSKIQFFTESISHSRKSSFYLSDEQDELIEFTGYFSLEDLIKNESRLIGDFFEFKEYISGDIKREILRYIESPISSKTAIPLTEYVQLRYVEVPPCAYKAYLQWRDETIFNVVRENDDIITSFDAYHSLISGIPGVMFISSFSGDVDSYLKPFTDERYNEIVRQAGNSYITGGNHGLYTKIYKKLGAI